MKSESNYIYYSHLLDFCFHTCERLGSISIRMKSVLSQQVDISERETTF